MNKKIVVILEIAVLLGMCGLYFITTLIPEYKASKGSSDKLISLEEYQGMYEFNFGTNINFMFVVNTKSEVYHIMFLDKNSGVLYNKNIENNSLDKALDLVIKILIEDSYLVNGTNLVVTSYGLDNSILNSSLENIYKKYGLNYLVNFNLNTVKQRGQTLGIRFQTSDLDYVREIDFYSQEFVRTFKSQKKIEESKKEFNKDSLNKALEVYDKLEEFVNLEAVENYRAEESGILMNSIVLEDDVSPTTNSWFYVENYKMYAYVEFLDNGIKHGYCFNGSKEKVVEGECK